MDNYKLKQLIQWMEVNIKNLKKQRADNLYMEGVKQGMIKNGELILARAKELLGETNVED